MAKFFFISMLRARGGLGKEPGCLSPIRWKAPVGAGLVPCAPGTGREAHALRFYFRGSAPR